MILPAHQLSQVSIHLEHDKITSPDIKQNEEDINHKPTKNNTSHQKTMQLAGLVEMHRMW